MGLKANFFSQTIG